MKGSIQTSKKYPYVQVYWNGQSEKFYSYEFSGRWFPIRTESEAEKILSIIRHAIDDGDFNPRHFRPNSPLLVKEYWHRWLAVSTTCNNTKKKYRWAFTKYILPHFGNTDMRKINKLILTEFYQSIPKATKTKYNILTTFKTMLRFAYDNNDIKRVPPFPALSNPAPAEIEYLDVETQERVLTEIPERHRPIFIFMMETGVRVGEARALMKDCVRENEVVIKRSFSEYELRETTKTGRSRVVDLTDRGRKALIQAGKQAVFGSLVFARNDKGSAYDGKLLNRLWKTACKTCGISIPLKNATRHSVAGQLLDLGYDYYDVADALGHTKPEMTRQRYGRRSKKNIKEMLEQRHKVVDIRKLVPGAE